MANHTQGAMYSNPGSTPWHVVHQVPAGTLFPFHGNTFFLRAKPFFKGVFHKCQLASTIAIEYRFPFTSKITNFLVELTAGVLIVVSLPLLLELQYSHLL